MDNSHIEICKLTKRVGNKQLLLFTKIVRSHLLNAGVDKQLLEKTLKEAVVDFRKTQTYDTDCTEALSTIHTNAKENRGCDSIGRILVELCFIQNPQHRMVWPENSERDTQARISFTENVIPRPLMRYFLVSVRGSIPELDNFEAESVLFGQENAVHEERKAYVDKLLKEYATSSNGTCTLEWKAIYEDVRFKKIALELIGEIRRKIDQFGTKRYLRIIENIQQKDPDKTRKNSMERAFTIDDILLIDDALWTAEGTLAQIIE